MGERVIVITGASSGFGAALAELVARQGAHVVLVARRRERLEAVATRGAGRAVAIVADVTQREDLDRVVADPA